MQLYFPSGVLPSWLSFLRSAKGISTGPTINYLKLGEMLVTFAYREKRVSRNEWAGERQKGKERKGSTDEKKSMGEGYKGK